MSIELSGKKRTLLATDVFVCTYEVSKLERKNIKIIVRKKLSVSTEKAVGVVRRPCNSIEALNGFVPSDEKYQQSYITEKFNKNSYKS